MDSFLKASVTTSASFLYGWTMAFMTTCWMTARGGEGDKDGPAEVGEDMARSSTEGGRSGPT
jgi:hypothetical protein